MKINSTYSIPQKKIAQIQPTRDRIANSNALHLKSLLNILTGGVNGQHIMKYNNYQS